MSAALKLESPEALPTEFRRALAPYAGHFQETGFLEHVLRHQPVKSVAQELDQFLATQRIHAYHCTKEPEAGYFEQHGLRLTDVANHQAWFLEHFGHRFTADQVRWLREAWQQYFVRERQAELRNGLLFACLSRSLVANGGCDDFFQYFGGEAISMVAGVNPGVDQVLEAIGRPVVVEVALDGAALTARYPMSYAVLSSYHKQLRPDAAPYESEASWKGPVSAADVLQVTPRQDFA